MLFNTVKSCRTTGTTALYVWCTICAVLWNINLLASYPEEKQVNLVENLFHRLLTVCFSLKIRQNIFMKWLILINVIMVIACICHKSILSLKLRFCFESHYFTLDSILLCFYLIGNLHTKFIIWCSLLPCWNLLIWCFRR